MFTVVAQTTFLILLVLSLHFNKLCSDYCVLWVYINYKIISLVLWQYQPWCFGHIYVKEEDDFSLVAPQVKSIFTMLCYFCERLC